MKENMSPEASQKFPMRPVAPLGVIAMNGCEEMGRRVNDYLMRWQLDTSMADERLHSFFGADANGGRVMCALGYSGADLDPQAIDVDFISAAGTLPAYRQGSAVAFSEEFAKRVLTEKEIVIDVRLNGGAEEATAWGCDLTYDYVKINGDYRT